MVALSLFDAFVQGMCTALNFVILVPKSLIISPWKLRCTLTLGEVLLRVPVVIFHHSVASIPAGVQLIHRDSISLERKYEQLYHGKTETVVYYVGVCEAVMADVTPTNKRSL